MLPYYILEKTESCKQFFYSHIGLYNFWNQYLILSLGYNIYGVLVNRPYSKFHGIATKEQDECFKTIAREHLEAYLPKGVFIDFPELEIIRENTLR